MSKISDDAAHWRAQAERALRLADSFHVQEVAATLRLLAAEYMDRALSLQLQANAIPGMVSQPHQLPRGGHDCPEQR